MGTDELVFKALADPTRRELLDELFRSDGQRLSDLAGRFAMTRVAVAKHLRLLEGSGLVVSRRRGREKLHFLNPIPIRLIHDRWVNKYTQLWAGGLVDLKHDLEAAGVVGGEPAANQQSRGEQAEMERVFEIYIKTTPERLWAAITDPETRARYHFGGHLETDWQVGSPYQLVHPYAPGPLVEGVNLEVDPPRRLVQSMHAVWDEDVAAEGTSRVTWEIEPIGDSCRLTLTHDQLREGADEQIYGGWPMILSGLKTWLEAGELLTTPGSQMYGG